MIKGQAMSFTKGFTKGQEFNIWAASTNNSDFNQRYQWCLENLGPALDYPPRWQPIGNCGFRFRDLKDEMWFKLRWGG